MDSSTHKRCTKCLEVKDRSEFSKRTKSKDGLMYTCKECDSIRLAIYYENNQEKVKTRIRAYYNNNPEDWIKRTGTWRLANPDKRSAHNRTRRVKKAGAAPSKEITRPELRERDGDDCAYCHIMMDFKTRKNRPLQATVDHVLPLSLGGTDTLDNVVLACRRCNEGKGTKSVGEWLTQLAREVTGI